MIRDKEEIKEYLMIGKNQSNNYKDYEDILQTAEFIETEYEKELDSGNYGYALMSDFINTPFILEDEDEVKNLQEIKNINGIIFYKIIWRNEYN